MSIHKQLPTPIRNIRARLRFLLRPVFWAPAAVLVLLTILMSDYIENPEWLAEIQNQLADVTNNSDKADDLSKNERARTAEIDRESGKLKDLKRVGDKPTPAAQNKATQPASSKGLFEEISRQKESATETPSVSDSQKNNLLSGADNKPLNLNSASGIEMTSGANQDSGLQQERSPIETYSPIPSIDLLDTTKANLPGTPVSPLQAAIEKYQTGSISSLSAQTPTINQSGVQPFYYQAATLGQNPNPSNSSYMEAATGMSAPALSGQSSTQNYGLPETPGLTPGAAANATPNGNAYTYLTGSQPGTAASTAVPGTTSPFPGAAINYGQSPVPSLNPGSSLTNAPGTISPNYGQSPVPSLNPGSSLTNAPGTISPNYGQSPVPSLNPGSSLTNAPVTTSPLPIGTINYGQLSVPRPDGGNGLTNVPGVPSAAPTAPSNYGQSVILDRLNGGITAPGLPAAAPTAPIPGLTQGNGLRTATEQPSAVLGTQNNLTPANGLGNATGSPSGLPGTQNNYGRSQLPSFPANNSLTTPGYPYNSGNQGVQPVQPNQQPFSVPRAIPGRNIGGGQINTFSNP